MASRKISTKFVDPSGLEAFTACRLIVLDKCPGVRPVGFEEVAPRIISKAMARVFDHEIQKATDPLQTCALSGCEAAVHVMAPIV